MSNETCTYLCPRCGSECGCGHVDELGVVHRHLVVTSGTNRNPEVVEAHFFNPNSQAVWGFGVRNMTKDGAGHYYEFDTREVPV